MDSRSLSKRYWKHQQNSIWTSTRFKYLIPLKYFIIIISIKTLKYAKINIDNVIASIILYYQLC